MGRIRIGTASWTDKSLLESGKYYPAWCKTPADRLKFYASEFPVVEVDSSYYAMPSQRNAVLWAERTPRDFLFNVKAFRLFTQHPTQLAAVPREMQTELPGNLAEKRNLYYRDVPPEVRAGMWKMFEDALLPLDSAGKLGVVVFQFPPWFMPGSDAKRHILECQERLPQYRLAVEFRNAYWLSDRNRQETLGFLRDNNLGFVAVDEPQGFKSSVPPVSEVTSDTAIVRFHGRNKDTWEKKGLAASSERFNYYYTKDEMGEWVPRLHEMAERAQEMHLIMNTNYEDQGIVNARLLAGLVNGGLRTHQ
jgi:uncharacterized protein YecE (DUF72 family)